MPDVLPYWLDPWVTSPFVAQLVAMTTDADTGKNLYSWQEVFRYAGQQLYVYMPGGRTGHPGNLSAAVELNNHIIPLGTFVIMYQRGGTGGVTDYLFEVDLGVDQSYPSAATISGNADNLTPATWGPVLPLNFTGNYNLTGLVPPVPLPSGQVFLTTLVNVGTGTGLLTNQSGSSSSGNQFSFPGGGNYMLPPGGSLPIMLVGGSPNYWYPQFAAHPTVINLTASQTTTYSQSTTQTFRVTDGGGNPAFTTWMTVVTSAGGVPTVTLGGNFPTVLTGQRYETYRGTATISGNTSNLDLTTGWAPFLPLNVTGTYTLTGLVPPTGTSTTGRYLTATLANVGSGTLTLANESASSTAANRFTLPSAADVTVPSGGSQPAYYDPVSTRWLLGAPPAAGPGSSPTGTNGQVTGVSYSCTSSLADTGLALSIPSAGTYLVWWYVEATVDAGSVRAQWTDGSAAGPVVTLAGVDYAGTHYRTGFEQDIYAAAGAATVKLQAMYGGGASTGTINSPSRMGYVKLA